jgi:predicted nuclease with RNAse H fold
MQEGRMNQQRDKHPSPLAVSRLRWWWWSRCLDVKTSRIYSWLMPPSRLFNVRLSPEDARLVERLRARGISLSEVMRRAVRKEAAELKDEPVDADALIEDLLTQFPTPAAVPSQRPDATDRHAVREHIRKRLRAVK